MRLELRDRCVYFDGSRPITEIKDIAGVPAAKCAHGLLNPGETGVCLRVQKGEHGNLLGFEMALLHQVVDHRGALLRVAGTIIKDIAVGRVIPHKSRTAKLTKTKNMMFKDIGKRSLCVQSS